MARFPSLLLLGDSMLELDRATRDDTLLKRFYARLQLLGSKLNSRISGGPIFTIAQAFTAMVSDVMDEVIILYSRYNPATATGAAQREVLGFFEIPYLSAAACSQTFTIIRTTSASPLVIPVGATIQTPRQQDGSVRSYTIGDEPDFSITIAIGSKIGMTTFTDTKVGSAGIISTPQPLEIASGFSGAYVFAGKWIGASADPLSTLGTVGNETIDKWFINNVGNFEMAYRTLGRDDESDESYYARCTSRWDTQAVGATAGSYESWVKNYLDPLTNNAPFVSAKVTDSQIFVAATCTDPALQPLVDGSTYIIGVEVAVATAYGTFPTPAQKQAIADSLYTLKPHTDRVWVRGPLPVYVTTGNPVASISFLGPASFLDEISSVCTSFFAFDPSRKENYRGLGSEIYRSDLVHAVRSISDLIDDVRVVFTLPGSVNPDGDIILESFEQIVVEDPTTCVTVAVR